MANSRKGHKYVSGLLTFGLILLLLLMALFTGAFVSFSYVRRARENFNNPKPVYITENDRIYLNIPSGSRTDSIAKILHEYELIQYPQLFKILSKINGFDGHYRSGTHIVSKDLSYDELMIVLKSEPETVRIMFPEGINMRQLYEILADSDLMQGGDTEKFAESRNADFDYDFLGMRTRYGMRAERFEGYMFPDTYDFDLNASPRAIIDMFLNNFGKKLTDSHRDRAEALGLTLDEVVTLASLIEREARNEEERFLVSGVFHNRLFGSDAEMRRLQSCATIQYVIYQKYGYMPRRITDADTRIPDAYNTYLHEGLPPGPICNPGISSINAALYPERSDYYFFVARGDGSHVFSKTYAEHRDAIQEYGWNLMP